MADGEIPTAEEILRIHSRIEEKYDLKHKGTMKTAPKFKLRREVLEPAAEYDDPYHRAAVLLFGIPSVHVFEDGNKRTAWIATQEYLERSGINSEVLRTTEPSKNSQACRIVHIRRARSMVRDWRNRCGSITVKCEKIQHTRLLSLL